MKGTRVWGLGIRLITIFCLIFVFLYPIPYTLYPVYADVDIGKNFGFGGLTSLGKATSQLVSPIFSIATTLVVFYFLLGAFRYLKSGENKEEVEAAKKVITQSIVGFVILMFAFLVLQFLLSSLFKIKFSIIG